ncbi:hypothetical protein V6N13_068827 [Hibiscus sabdariffa]
MDVPSEPFGPWMLVEKRQRRQPKKVNPGEPPAPPSLAQGSRFNPIFMDDTTVVDTVDQDALQTEVEAAMPEAVNTTVKHESEIAIPQNARESVLKARTKGKATLLIRKPSATVLTPKNLNIMPRKSSSSVPSSSRSKGRNAQPSLNPARHGAVVISTKSAPLIPTQVSPQERDTVRRQSRAQEGIGDLANSMVDISDGFDSFLATFIYASPSHGLRGDLWHHLRALASTIMQPWAIIGDFNATLLHQDRKGCSSNNPDRDFQSMVFDCSLYDLDYLGPEFTWYRGFCSVRLDRCLSNSLWFETFPSSTLHHLLRMKSDHRPLLLSSSSSVPSSSSPMFKYFAGWSKHPDFKSMVAANWDSSQPLSDTIQSFTAAASAWNKEVFGSIGKNKKIIMARLRGVQHQARLREAASTFFAALFTASTTPSEAFPISGFFPPLEDASYSALSSMPNDNEIKEALFSMAPLKAPELSNGGQQRIDALDAQAFEAFLGTVGGSLEEVIPKEGQMGHGGYVVMVTIVGKALELQR